MPFVYQELSARSLLITQRSRPRAGAGAAAGSIGRSDVAESVRFVHALGEQHVDVLEQESSALLTA